MITYKNAFTLVLACFYIACSSPVSGADLRLIDSFKVRDKENGFSEPSGLSKSSMDGLFWSISDAEAKLHLLESDGSVKQAFHLPELKGADLEGVAARPDGSVLLVQEKDRTLVVVEPGVPSTVKRIALRDLIGFSALAPMLKGNPANKGPEGITVDPKTGSVFVAIEGQPRLLVKISPDLTEIVSATLLTAQMGFFSSDIDDEELDVSGLAWSVSDNTLWILSDKGRLVFVFDIERNEAEAIALRYEHKDKTKTVKKAEGIALDEEKDRLYVLTDDGSKSRLFVFEKP